MAQWVGHCPENQKDYQFDSHPVREHAWGVGQVPGWSCVRVNILKLFSHIDVSLPFLLPPFPSL